LSNALRSVQINSYAPSSAFGASSRKRSTPDPNVINRSNRDGSIRDNCSYHPVTFSKNSSNVTIRDSTSTDAPASSPASNTHARKTDNVGSISRFFRSANIVLQRCQTSFDISKCSFHSPRMITDINNPHPSSSRRLVLTFDRATDKVSAISSASNGRSAKYNNAKICATVRLIPHFVPISPQCRTNRVIVGDSFIRYSINFCRY